MYVHKPGRRLLRFRSVRKAESARNGMAVRVVTDWRSPRTTTPHEPGHRSMGSLPRRTDLAVGTLVAGFDCLDDWTDDGAVGMRGWYY
jgi:hypothetical protein